MGEICSRSSFHAWIKLCAERRIEYRKQVWMRMDTLEWERKVEGHEERRKSQSGD